MRDWWLPRLTIRSALLLPLAALFGCAVALRRAAYRAGLPASQRLPVPVIVIGNLTVGGSGKTPLVIALIHALREHGWQPGVISRGFGRAAAAPATAAGDALEVRTTDDPTRCGDEPLLIARATGVPVFVAASRPRAGRALLAAHPEVNIIVSDDGLQHYALARDIEIAVFDERGAGNGCLLPAGPLREPLSRATGLTALVANDPGGQLSKSGLHQRFSVMYPMKLSAQPCYRLSTHLGGQPGGRLGNHPLQPGDTATLAALATRTPRGRIAAVAGIGNPARFFATLGAAGLGDSAGFAEHVFPDHHLYTRADLSSIDAELLIVTEKDALKCAAFNDDRIWVLPVTAEVDGALITLILEKLRGRQAA